MYNSKGYLEDCNAVEYLTGLSMDKIKELLMAGYTLQAPSYKEKTVRCSLCNDTGFIQIAPGVRGIKRCPKCNGGL